MTSVPKQLWTTSRGDEWWCSNPGLSGSLDWPIRVFKIDDPVGGTAPQLWALRAQFPDLEIQCAYDPSTKTLLDQLQQEGLLRWSDVGNPHSRYARIEVLRS
jgi:hypothetical protein